jgi:hypothetical protein
MRRRGSQFPLITIACNDLPWGRPAANEPVRPLPFLYDDLDFDIEGHHDKRQE